MTLFDGIRSRLVETPGLNVNILERDGDDPSTPPERTVVFIHGNVSSALFWQEVMQDLPSDLRVLAIDLRGFGGTEHAPVDATRGVRDFSDDVWATLQALGLKHQRSVELDDNPAIRGMVFQVRHMVKVEETEGQETNG